MNLGGLKFATTETLVPRPAPKAVRRRAVATTYVAIAHFLFAAALILFGCYALLVFLGVANRPPDFSPQDVARAEKLLGQLTFSAVVLIVWGIAAIGAGTAMLARERSGFVLTLAFLVADAGAIYSAVEMPHPGLLLLLWVAWLAVPHGIFVGLMFLNPSLWRDFWSRR